MNVVVAILLGNHGNVHDLLLGHRYRHLDELVVVILLGNLGNVHWVILWTCTTSSWAIGTEISTN